MPRQWNLAASVLACFSRRISASAHFHRSRNLAYASFAWFGELAIASARAVPSFASGADQQPTTIPASVGNFDNFLTACLASFPAWSA